MCRRNLNCKISIYEHLCITSEPNSKSMCACTYNCRYDCCSCNICEEYCFECEEMWYVNMKLQLGAKFLKKERNKAHTNLFFFQKLTSSEANG